MNLGALIIWVIFFIIILFFLPLLYRLFSGSLVSIARRGSSRIKRESSLSRSLLKSTEDVYSYYKNKPSSPLPKDNSPSNKLSSPLPKDNPSSNKLSSLPDGDTRLTNYISETLAKIKKIEIILKKDEEELRKTLYLIRGYEVINDTEINEMINTIKTLININLGRINKTKIAIASGRKLISNINSRHKFINSFNLLVSVQKTISEMNLKRSNDMGAIVMLCTSITQKTQRKNKAA